MRIARWIALQGEKRKGNGGLSSKIRVGAGAVRTGGGGGRLVNKDG
tara:strand:- start:361 stop:498 length:138 start_codon:yes stop_codon:yes gene_type:complete